MSTTAANRQRKPVFSRRNILGFGWFGVGLVGAIISYVNLGSAPTVSANPRFWPMMGSLIMAGSGLIIGVQGVLGSRNNGEVEPQIEKSEDSMGSTDKETSQSGDTVVRPRSHIFLFAALLIYVLIVPVVGYVLTTFIFLVISLWLVGMSSFWKGPVIAALLTVGTAYLFGNLLSIALPRGSGVLYMLDSIFF